MFLFTAAAARTGALGLGIEEEHGIVGGQDRATAVAKDGRRAFIRYDLHDHLGTGHFLTGKRMTKGAGLDDRVAHGSAVRSPKRAGTPETSS